MKRNIYILATIFLGLFLQQIVHMIVEGGYIYLFTIDYNLFSLGLSWNMWLLIHHILTGFLVIYGVIWGYRKGKYWWDMIYVRKDFSRRWWRK